MRLYALHKRQFVAVFVVFFICLFFTLLIGIVGPSAIRSKQYDPETTPKQIVIDKIFRKRVSLQLFHLI